MTNPQMPPQVDPSENVLDLVDAAVTRIDDLRRAHGALERERHKGARREAKLRAKHAERVAHAEASRTDALRELDRLEVRTATERHQLAVDTLDKATKAMAETLRAGAENIAKTLAAQTDAYRKEFDARISALERLQAAGSGKGAGLNAAWAILGSLIALLAAIYALGPKIFGH